MRNPAGRAAAGDSRRVRLQDVSGRSPGRAQGGGAAVAVSPLVHRLLRLSAVLIRLIWLSNSDNADRISREVEGVLVGS